MTVSDQFELSETLVDKHNHGNNSTHLKGLDESITAISLSTSNDSQVESKEDVPKQNQRCTDCGRRTSNRSYMRGKLRGACDAPGCNALLCRSCKKKYPLMLRCNFNMMDTDPFDEKILNEWRTAKIHRFCRSCYINKSILNFDTNTWLLEPKPEIFCKITLIISHGAGGSRASYLTQAREMTKIYGVRCILMDMAGHGARWEEKCTLQNCLTAIKEVLENYNIKSAKEQESNGHKTLFVSSSWGGYIGYKAMSEFAEYFSGMVADTCVLDLSRFWEKIKWRAISTVVKTKSNYEMMKFLQSKWDSHNEPYMDFVETQFGAGLYGKCEPMKSLSVLKVEECVPKIRCPILFLNGTEDPDGFDSKYQNKLLNMLITKKQSKVVTFEGGNHFFSHDSRYFQKWCEEVVVFAKAETTLTWNP